MNSERATREAIALLRFGSFEPSAADVAWLSGSATLRPSSEALKAPQRRLCGASSVPPPMGICSSITTRSSAVMASLCTRTIPKGTSSSSTLPERTGLSGSSLTT